MVNGIFATLLEVYVVNRIAAISRAAPSPMSPHAAIRSAAARFKPCLLIVAATGRIRRHPTPRPGSGGKPDPNSPPWRRLRVQGIRHTGRRGATRDRRDGGLRPRG